MNVHDSITQVEAKGISTAIEKSTVGNGGYFYPSSIAPSTLQVPNQVCSQTWYHDGMKIKVMGTSS